MNAAAHPYMLIYDEDYVRHRLDFCQDEAMKYMLASNMFQHYGTFNRSQFWDLAFVSSFRVSYKKLSVDVISQDLESVGLYSKIHTELF